MTKLEKKLQELGYKSITKLGCFTTVYAKYNATHPPIIIKVSYLVRFKIEDYYVDDNREIRTQQGVDNLQLALDVMQKDLEVLKEYEEKI